jgi:thiol:disulfide interchange protein DsbD
MAIAAGGSVYWGFSQVAGAPAQQGVAIEGKWKAYDEPTLQAALKENRPVFIDFTAAWCITCQVNERVALDVEEVQKKFEAKRVLMLKADWTNQDAGIAKKLESYGRNGVPLYVLYSGAGRPPEILPQLLTPQIVLQALDAM